MSKEKYWIESVTSDEFKEMYTVRISCPSHGLCVKVYGTKFEATERAIKIIEGLNNERI